MAENGPRGRKKNVTGSGTGGHKTGSGIGGGPIGQGDGYSGRPGGMGSNPGHGGPDRAGGSGNNGLLLAGLVALLLGKKGGKGSLVRIIVIAIIAFFLLKSCGIVGGVAPSVDYGTGYDTSVFTSSGQNQPQQGGSYYTQPQTQEPVYTPKPTPRPTPKPEPQSQSSSGSYGSSYGDLASLLGGFGGGYTSVNSGSTSSGWIYGDNRGKLNTSVAPGAREKFYTPGRKDTVTIMVYMCGTDLESNYSMATNDLKEMASASLNDDVNLIVYTGGCTGWKNNLMSSKTNQVWQVLPDGGFNCLVQDAGNVSMTKPDTLASFIQFCAKNFPADRNELILWDHGGGSISGYGYDQKFKSSGSMSLAGIDNALKAGGVKFDFIGFDACLMATAETALVCSDYADYLIASEESEPGIGWYYTNWLTKLCNNTSVSTLEVGKQIVDDFIDVCAQQCRGQDTTLSVTDLAELSQTIPAKLREFSTATTAMIQSSNYKTVSTARGSAKEFASSSKIDQCDLTNLCCNLNTEAGKKFADALLSAVKYNRTSSTVKNAYGLSIFFPYRSMSSVNSAVSTYNNIGIDSEYSRCIKAFATYASGGQASSGYSSYSGSSASPYGSLFDILGSVASSGSSYGSSSGHSSGYSNYGSSYGSSYGNSYGYGSSISADDIYSVLSALMGGRNLSGVRGINESNCGFIADSFSDGTLDIKKVAQYLSENQLDASSIVWTDTGEGPAINFSEDQWSLISDLVLNVFLDDGEGFVDLGTDLTEDAYTESGALNGVYDGTWTALNNHLVTYYHVHTTDDGENWQITGRVPVLYNGQRANLILVFDNENEYGYVAGVRYDYVDGETDTIAKAMDKLSDGDELVFLCDYYAYDGTYSDTYQLGEPMTVNGDIEISYIDNVADFGIPEATYKITDIYGQSYWTPIMKMAA